MGFDNCGFCSEKVITYWPPLVCLEGRARHTKLLHVSQTLERKSEMSKNHQMMIFDLLMLKDKYLTRVPEICQL